MTTNNERNRSQADKFFRSVREEIIREERAAIRQKIEEILNLNSMYDMYHALKELHKELTTPQPKEATCKHCHKKVHMDLEGDLVHTHLEDKGCDPRLCDPSNGDSLIAAKEGE